MKATTLWLVGLAALGSVALAQDDVEFYAANVETGGPKASLNNQFVDVSKVNGEYMVYFAPSGYVWYSINKAGHLRLYMWSDSTTTYNVIGTAYIDENDNDSLKFGNGTSNPPKFTVNNEYLEVADESKAWFWCPHDKISNGTLALKPVSPALAAEKCEKLDHIYYSPGD